ncbi:Protein of unknown function [Algoriphagus locisalis]|uniref:DUF4199 domain-containing protein n=1 Tax=Algoriphagus locisalis TaxID=305507 RepID=A0A1I7CKE3_9BACT|nr:DUF4199 domain-containing protein [Algoriphagus locisalis]SFT99892.1 Protein of unknown function [Algoriphagus locisalis]
MYKYFSSAYKFGSIAGALSVIAFVALSFLYPDPTNLNLVFGYVISPIAIFLAIKFFKEYSNNGYLSFAEGMSLGFVTYMLEAILSLIGIWIVLQIHPNLFEQIKASKLDVLATSKDSIVSQVGLESYGMTLESVKNMVSLDIALNDGLWKIIPGLFFTIIISIILRRNPN